MHALPSFLSACLPACFLEGMYACHVCMYVFVMHICLPVCNYKLQMHAGMQRSLTYITQNTCVLSFPTGMLMRTHAHVHSSLPSSMCSFIHPVFRVHDLSLSLSFSHIHKYRHACMHACMHRIIHSCIFVYISSGLLACLHADLQKYVLELKPLNRLSGTL